MAATLSYFALLGVSEDVSQEELEARYQELAEYLASPAIPAHLRDWARRQAALVDEAYAVLADPERRAAARRQEQAPAAAEGGARSGPEAASGASADQTRPRDTEQRGDAQRKGKRPAGPDRPAQPAAAQAGPARPGAFSGLLNLRSQPILLGVLMGLVVLGGILLGRYGLPGGGGEEAASPPQQAGAMAPLDTERIAELMAAVQKDPSNPEVLFELGETFFQAGEWQSAIDWFTRLLAVDPNNTHAMTDVGTANFNLGRPEEAEAQWLAVLELDPDNVQVHYNLGFLYANAEPRDLASARQEWQTVMELAPDSDLARTAQVHLDGLPEEAEEEAPPTPAEGAGDTSEAN